jgi:hypothetical protein
VDSAKGLDFVQANWNSAPLLFSIGSQSENRFASAVSDNTGAVNPAGIAFSFTLGDIHDPSSVAGAFSAQVSDTHNPNGGGLYQDSLLGGFGVSSTGPSPSVFSFNNVPAIYAMGGSYDVVAYLENYDLSYAHISLVAGSGSNPITGTASLNVLEQGGRNDSVNNGQPNGVFDGSTFLSNPLPASSTLAPSTVSNYVIFTGVGPDANGNITVDWAATSFTSPPGFSAYQALDAIQLISVPEPASWVFVTSILVLAGLRRQRI